MVIDEDVYLEHFGVKGMHWGIRKERPIIDARAKGIKIGSDGSIDIQPGASLQRLVRKSGKSRAMKDITYASINEYDNNRYIKKIGGKGFFGGGRDQVLDIKATKPIKAPNLDKSTELVSELFLSDKKFRESVISFSQTISDKDLQKIRENPSGKTAKVWYDKVNLSLTVDKEFDPGSPYVQKRVKDHFIKNGFNAVRDENDFRSGLAKAPIIIFAPEKSLKVVRVIDITDKLRKASKERLRDYKRLGRSWADKHLYD